MTLLVDCLHRDRARWDKVKSKLEPGSEIDVLARWLSDSYIPVYDISNVAVYIAENDTEYGSLTDFPNVAPPHRVYWMEWARPDRLMGGLFRVRPDRVAVLFWESQPADDETWFLTASVWAQWRDVIEPQCVWEMQWHRDGHPRITQDHVAKNVCKQWYPRVHRDLDPPTADELAEVAGLTKEQLQAQLVELETRVAKSNERMDALTKEAIQLTVLHPALMAHSFLACKNVDVIDNQPPIRLSKNHARKHGTPLTVYKTLRINAFGDQRSTNVGVGFGGGQRLHIVRGHFKTFTVDRPLFGKYSGSYWWTPRLRGSAERGVVVKDYAVEVPS